MRSLAVTVLNRAVPEYTRLLPRIRECNREEPERDAFLMRYFSGIEHRPVGEKDKKTLTTSDAYLEAFGELFPQGRIDLLDHPVLIRELRGLEMRP